MESHRNWWTSSRSCTRTLNAESYTIASCQNLSELTPVSSKDASCRLCSSPWQWTGSCELSPKEDAGGIRWTLIIVQDAQQKTEHLSETANTIGLKVNTKKPQVLRKNTRVIDPVMIDGKHLEYVEEFTNLDTYVTTTGDCDQKIWISKASLAFAMLRSAWRTTNLSVNTRIKVFRNNMLSILLCEAECWKTTVTIQQELEVFQTFDVFSRFTGPTPSQAKNWEVEQEWALAEIIQTQLWWWLGHVCRLPSNSLRARGWGDDQERQGGVRRPQY